MGRKLMDKTENWPRGCNKSNFYNYLNLEYISVNMQLKI